MSAIDDGGPAFPTPYRDKGMSLRDWFAGMAMPAVCLEAVGELSESQIASDAYRIADAMLAARKPAPAPEPKCAIAHDLKNLANFCKDGRCIVCGADWPIPIL